MERSELAKSLFLSGNNCAQSVLLSFADDLKYSKELALRLSAGFGAGMGRMQETCGAVTGAIMVLGIMQGERVNNNADLKNVTYGSVRELNRRFSDAYGTTSCSKLTGCDLNTQEGKDRFEREHVMENVCAGCVEKAVRIVESVTGEK